MATMTIAEQEPNTEESSLLGSNETEQTTLALAGIYRKFGTIEIRRLDAYHQQVSAEAVTLMRFPYPPGFERDHIKDINHLTAVHDMYDAATEQRIHDDRPMTAIRGLARTLQRQGQNPNNNADLVNVFHLRRTTVAYMRRYVKGAPVQLGKKD